ncbi:MAG TPA: hypothetical protein VHG72_10320 [Polyangia bacterium]|nr:hypothetical protein [Polyangia bacterium]
MAAELNLTEEAALKFLKGYERQMNYDAARKEFSIRGLEPSIASNEAPLLVKLVSTLMQARLGVTFDREGQLEFTPGIISESIASKLADSSFNFPGVASVPSKRSR